VSPVNPVSFVSDPLQTTTDSLSVDDLFEPWGDTGGFDSETSGEFPSPQGSCPESNTHSAPRVLLAHADETRREGLAWELGARGCTVVEVEDGSELLDYLIDGPRFAPLPRPDVIVAELDMPGCSGLEAATKLRARGNHIPIVFINVSHAPSAALRAARLSETHLLDGDIEGGVLLAAVDTALRNS
jgi:CheY-like chemotaxis protein